MSRYIDADKLKRHYAWWDDETKKIFDEIIDLQPAADVQEVRRGRWIKTKDLFFNPDGGGFFYGKRCSSCTEISASATNYCPNCGARMEADE